MLTPRYIVYRKPTYSPGDYYGCLMNTIDDIRGVFKSREREKAEEYCKNIQEDVTIHEIDWEE